MSADMIRALYEERAALLARGLTDRVRQVDEQLAYHGDHDAAARIRAATTPARTDAPDATAAPRPRTRR